MAEESPVVLPPAEESIEAETDTALEPEAESGEPTPQPTGELGFVCDCQEWMLSACDGLPFYKAHESRRYCVLHYPGKEKSAAFKAALDHKLNEKDFDFRGVWFPDKVEFRRFEFSADADFSSVWFTGYASFGEATFSADASFNGATFREGPDFGEATFSASADFSAAHFHGTAFFHSARFGADADFSWATFGAVANFIRAAFSGPVYFNRTAFNSRALFEHASFKDSLQFFGRTEYWIVENRANIQPLVLGDDPSLDFQHVRIEHPERATFHTLILRPHWFVNVDPRKFIFTHIDWHVISIKQELTVLQQQLVRSRNRLLEITCRQLAENAEANNRYEEASRFRHWAMDLARRRKWKRWAFWRTDWLHVLYWLVSGYGERILRALGVLAAVWIVFALLYTQVGFVRPEDKSAMQPKPDTTGQPLPITRSFTYSLAVMSLQKPEPKPLTGTAQTLVLLETILGPVQAALLALAIRRKFMR